MLSLLFFPHTLFCREQEGIVHFIYREQRHYGALNINIYIYIYTYNFPFFPNVNCTLTVLHSATPNLKKR